ncbi:MAG TPA: hypothetical protein VD794_02260 [Flavisolibacter sp.]|nr:hypothetical protein [Flavisolibacter sp.]
MRPLKSEFKNYVDFTDHVPDSKINPHIENTLKYHIRPFFLNKDDEEKDLGRALDLLSDEEPSLTPELLAFYNSHVKEWWILLAFKRFIVNHGLNVTQFGYTKLTDPERTFEPASDLDRSKILKMLQNDINVVEANIRSYLSDINWTLDGTIFSTGTCKKTSPSFGINAIGRPKKKGCGDCYNGKKQVDTSDYFPDDYD